MNGQRLSNEKVLSPIGDVKESLPVPRIWSLKVDWTSGVS